MDMQEPEEQRLEDEPVEAAEDVVGEASEEPALSDSDASEPEEEPAPAIESDDEAAEVSVDDVEAVPADEAVADSEAVDEAESVSAEVESVEETIPEPDVPMDEHAEATSVETEVDTESAPEGSTEEEVETVSDEEEPQPETQPEDDPSAWFVVHCYSGYENKVRHNLEQRIETMGMKDMIFDVVVPTQEEIEVRDGKRRTVERHIFPGYVLVNMILTEESWYVVRNTPGVTGFVGMGNNPTPLRPEEVSQIVKRMEADAPTVKVTFKVGERVRIIDGPFNDFRGVVSEIDMERTKVRVMVSFFGRETPVELDFLQVEKS
jgi:transcriptional antiterminator NusG